ncbi:adenylosuccinate lyase [Aquimarina gracilis]|uniref:Adenylosuccinate lyase n=1 Tax=Aquimarina gracilis TaxID=874422 RepID=A0ABU5ZV34_9FLAO|nr:adenylosuccinate lyase [Aquimarina gracilis]MEB3345898.1 adenylosuccinate lyase [Aquimarina gracilis]
MISLEEVLTTINATRERRSYFANLVLENPETIPELLTLCNRIDDDISCKASWGLEFLCKKNLKAILPYLDQVIAIASRTYKHSAVRPMAKIFEILILGYYKQKSQEIINALTQTHREKITEICFDWLITDQKVAPKAYAMTTLYLLGTEFDWVHPELKITLENNYATGSAAYKARSRMVLKKIS